MEGPMGASTDGDSRTPGLKLVLLRMRPDGERVSIPYKLLEYMRCSSGLAT